MAHLECDLDDLLVVWDYVRGKRKAFLVAFHPETHEVVSQEPISTKVAEILIKHGMASGT